MKNRPEISLGELAFSRMSVPSTLVVGKSSYLESSLVSLQKNHAHITPCLFSSVYLTF